MPTQATSSYGPAAGPGQLVDADSPLDHLVVEAREGDERAWEVLYVRCQPRLLIYARRRLPSAEHAHDAVAETMARALSSIGTWRNEGGGFHAWLYGILRHVVADHQRAMHRERPAPGADVSASGREEHDTSEPHEPLLLREDAATVRSALAGLSPTERHILQLRVVAGVPAEQVARDLGRRPGAVRMAQSRALARLRAHLEA